MPSPLLRGKSPHEILFDKPPSYSHLRVFGCLCFACNINIKNKFDQRGKPGIFVGYPYAQKGYRIFYIDSKKIFTSRDVTFHETVFPYQDIPAPSLSSSVHPLPIADNGTFNYSPSLPAVSDITSSSIDLGSCTPHSPPKLVQPLQAYRRRNHNSQPIASPNVVPQPTSSSQIEIQPTVLNLSRLFRTQNPAITSQRFSLPNPPSFG